jgi:tRNA modification GTPase
MDTAGLRDTDEVVEAEGVARSKQAQRVADLVLLVVDGSNPLDDIDRDLIQQVADHKGLVVCNKSDLPPADDHAGMVDVSALSGMGIKDLRRQIVSALDVDLLRERPAITNMRHIALVQRAHEALERARAAAAAGGAWPEEFLLADLQDARSALEQVTGRRAPEDVLEHIFTRFCIGK